ncbi:mucin-2 isoform X10 [Musca domestica]|uniref:Mucin-2 isoform X10 n=1 Tax=Musca domestica TaxID=7370 RepID=A0ABM3UVU0_MUSDO|nr:mucin-2 isoform X10 [Musca domestica]
MFVSIDRIGCVVVVVVAAVVRLYVCQCCCRRHTYTVTSPIEATTTAPSAPTPTSQPTYCNRPASPSASQSHQPPTFSSVNAGFSNFSVILVLDRNWQQSEDINRKKEIRSQLYKLRESRLRDLYQFDIMADNNVAGFGKDPLAPSHGESFGDQSFQSLKSKEIRDSMSPSELKFQSMALNNPSSTGWNVQSSSEVTPDGRGFRAETIATTDGVEHINGGTAEFKGRNEQRSMAMQEGDDKNFVKKASESSNTHLQEKVVIGDENSGRTEIRTSSSTSTSSSKVFQSSSTTEYENDHPVDYHQPKYLMDSAPQRMQEPQQYQQRPSQAEPRYEPRYEPQYYDDHQQQQYTNQQTEQYQRNRQETNTSQNVQTNETREQNKRYVDMDKASPEYQQHVQYLMSQPGEIISNTVEYPKPNVKMITTVKRLPDGTIVRNKRYETEETTPTPAPSQTNTTTRQTVTNTNNTQRRDSQPTYQQPKNYQGQPPSERLRRPSDDVVDNAETVRRHTTTNDDTVETKYSTTKTSNRKFSTETTSETIHEYDDGYQVPSGGPRPKPVTNDFSTHGFPSVRPNKPTQEFANHRPQAMHPSQASPSQKMTSPPPREALIPVRSEYEPTVTERRIPTEDGEVIVVSSEKKRSVKHHTNSERIIETDIRTTDDNRYEQISDVSTSKTNQDFSTHGFPSVREPQQGQPPSRTSPDYSTQGFPSVRGPQSQPNAHPDYRPQPSGPMQPTGSVTKTIQTPDGEVIVTSQKSHTTKYNTNSERIIETEVLGDDGRPVRRIPVDVEYVSDKYTVTTPGDQVPQKGFPSVRSPTKPVADYSTPHGFPSTRYSHQKPSTPDYSTQGFPSTRDTHKPSTPDYSTQGFPSTRDGPQPSSTPERQYVSPVKTPTSSSKPSPTVEATERIIRKEKEVDSAHRAFAASLRSSSPVDQTRRDSYSTDGPRHTPRSSVSSTKPFRRDMREGSHDSETSRISTTTVTRQTPPRSVGGKTVVVTERVTSSSSPRGTKSPSPGKNVTTTTTTTTRTVTNKAPVKDVPKSENRPPIKKTPGQTPYRPKTMITPTESVAARRSLFENHNNQATKPLARRPTPTSTSSSPSSGRRPSYMDHTKSSLEHIRRDSLEINKTNYTRRPSANDDDAPDRNSQVKFDVPQKPRSDVLDTDDSEYNIEEIFDLVILEKLLETVTSYEVRRRIRAQIRLVKKNMSNAEYTTVTTTSKRDNKTKPTSAQVISKKEEKQQQHYYYKEEHQRKERHSSTHTSPERVRTTQVTKVTTRRTESPDSKYSSPSEGRSVSPQSRLSQTRVCSRTHERSPSPSSVATEIKVKEVKKKQYENVEHVEEIYRESSPKIRKPKAYYPIDDDEEEVDTLSRPVKKTDVSEEYDSAELHEERTFKKETTHRRSSRKSISPQSSPERQKASSPRAGSPEGKKPLTSRVSPKSPERKTIITEQQQQQTLMTTKQQPKRTPVSAPLKSKPEPKAPVWADRKNILKSPSATPKKPSAVAPDSRISSSVSRTMKSSTQQQKVSSSTKSSYVEDDCITSSYGIGPTDENGLPLFGIRALKMKKPQQQQQPASEPICETTEEVTGYVVEEKYYSDNKSKPIVERKEIIYSTNPEELQAIKEKVRETATTTTTLKSLKHDKLESDDESPFRDNSTYKTKTITSVRSSPEEFLESSTTKYVRRGSVKEMSEKFLQKESASMVSEKTNNYPKAGLILRTNSRKQSRDNDDMDGENNEYYESRTSYRDTDEEDECRMVAGGEREYIVESESETESIKNTQREFKKITSTKSSSSSRSFLNTKGEEKIITGVDDVLDRMRNADNVVEEGDTAEDQEARALLNKFLGASIIMKGVESTIPTIPTVNRETKIITTTTTGVGSGRQPAKHEVKTTRVTKSIKSGSSSSPVIETTCDIEEIWDEEILKQLLEQAKTYEERRKIRSRLRELMADRAEKNSCQQTGKEEGESAAVAVVAAGKRVEELKSPVQRSESSASSEYEIIEEEVTCTESESEEVKETAETTAPQKEEELKQSSQEEEKEDTTSAPPDVVPTEPPSTEEQSQKQEEQQEKEEEKTVEETKESDTTDSAKETTDSCAEKDAKPQQSCTSTTEKTETKGKDGAVVTTTTKVTTRTVSGTGPKPVSPFAKFKQLDRQNSQQSTKSPTTPTTPGGGPAASPSATGNAPIFRFTDPSLNARAATAKEQLLQWCQLKTKEYENVQITNFSSSWVDGLAFCALIHHFLPDAFDYSKLTPQNRRENFELAFTVADEKAGIAPLLDVEDMVVMKRPDWKCVFVYVQSIYRRFRNCQ